MTPIGRLHHLLPYESYDEETGLYFNKRSTGFVMMADPLVGASFDDQGQMAHFLREERHLPEGSSLQILLYASPHVSQTLESWQDKRSPGMYQDLAQRRTRYLQENTLLRDFKVFISYTRPQILEAKSPELLITKEVLHDTFKEMGLHPTFLGPQDFIQEMREIFVQEETKVSYNPLDPISQQVLPEDCSLEVHKNHLVLGDKHLRCYVPSHTPREWALPFMDSFLGSYLERKGTIGCPFLIHYGFYALPSQAREKAKIFSKREAHAKSLQNSVLKWIPNLQSEHEEYASAAGEIQNGERLINATFSLTLIDKPQTISSCEYKLKSIATRAGWSFVGASYDHLPLFLSCLPMNLVEEKIKRFNGGVAGLGEDLKFFGRTKKTLTREAQNLLPLLGEWKGDKKSPGFLLVGRRGQVFTWSPFGSVLIPQERHEPTSNENFNLCIAGVPGSGKSVFMQELMLATLGVGGKVFVLDYGRSFKRTCALLQGEYIEFEIKNPLSLNPFSSIPEGDEHFEQREDALSNIYPILQSMAAPQDGTSDLQNAVLLKSMRRVWEQKKSKTEITDIAQDLLSQPEPYAKQLGDMLFPFTKKGLYGRFFAGPAQVSLNKDIVVIETDHLRNSPALLTVVVQMMIVHINQTMVKGNRRRPFLIMIDEAWKMLQGKSSGAFIEEAGRIARKYKGSIVLATQQITDYFKSESPASQKAFENASHKAILKQNPDTLTSLQEHPHLKEFVKNDYRLALMKSIHSNPPHYSEVALFSPGIHGVVGRLILDPFTRLLFSTNAEDYQALEEATLAGVPVTYAIESLLKKRNMA